DPTVGSVALTSQTLTDFQIQLSDGSGVGIDDSTVASARFLLTKNGTPLIDGVDYIFQYDSTNRIVHLQSTNGLWAANSIYVVTIDNSSATGIKDLAANPLQSNQQSGLTQFTIALLQMDFGTSPDPFPTLLSQDGARHIISDGLFLGSSVNPTVDG